nr:uncharacterized protein LOC118086908 isoform X1 [Zootoca vivipara]
MGLFLQQCNATIDSVGDEAPTPDSRDRDVSEFPTVSGVTDVSDVPTVSRDSDVSDVPTVSRDSDVSEFPTVRDNDVSEFPTVRRDSDVSDFPTVTRVSDVSEFPTVRRDSDVSEFPTVRRDSDVSEFPTVRRDSDVSVFPMFPVTTESSSLRNLVTSESALSISDDDAENATDTRLLEPDGDMQTATLVGLIFGVIIPVAFATGMTILVVKKMGR